MIAVIAAPTSAGPAVTPTTYTMTRRISGRLLVMPQISLISDSTVSTTSTAVTTTNTIHTPFRLAASAASPTTYVCTSERAFSGSV